MKIRQISDPILHTALPHVDFDQQPDLDGLLVIMTRQLRDGAGVGIACNQCAEIAEPYNIMLIGINDHDNRERAQQRYPDEVVPHETAMINVNITHYSDETYFPEAGEGCLSVHGPLRARVKRHRMVTVEYQDLQGKQHTEVYRGFTAHVIQHEFDHLCGITFVERVIEDLSTQQKDLFIAELEAVLRSKVGKVDTVSTTPNGIAFDRDANGQLIIDQSILHASLMDSAIETCQGMLQVLKW